MNPLKLLTGFLLLANWAKLCVFLKGEALEGSFRGCSGVV